MNNVNIQPSLFDAIPDDNKRRAAMAFESFKPELKNLHKQGFNSGSFDWWRSRWSDWLGYGGNETRESWRRKHDLDLQFPDVWEIYKNEFVKNLNR